ncbi:FH3 [Symbiodinium sp. CCMP2456]|nr:FH3 [Symbiodinium sp. CCMP2456]
MEHLSPQGTRLVAMQAFDESSKHTWMRILASNTQAQAPLPIQRNAAAAEAPPPQQRDLAASSESRAQPGGKGTASSSSSGKGSGKGPPVPVPSGKGASKGPGKGKGQVPPLPLGKGKGKGKAQPKAKASAKSLPFGKRLNMRDSGALPQTARGEQPSIFQGLFAKRAGQAQEDIDTLRSLFSETKASAGSGSGATSGTVSLAPSATPRKIFPDAVARNCQIVLRGLALRGPELVEAVKCLEPGPLDQDQLERLAQMMPEPSLMSQLDREAKGPCPSPLRDVEQQMVPFSQLGRLQERLKALILAANLQPQELRLMAQMQAVREACTQMRESSSLKHVLATVLVMYNYVNFGQVERAEARAFDIANLLHLNEFRADRSAPFPKFTALHYVAMRLLADESDESSGFHAKSIHTLQAELHRVSEAAGICLKYVSTSIEQLTEDIRKLREEQRANATVYGGTVDVEEPAPSPAPPPVPTPPVARRLTELSEVSECEEMTPRVDLIPQQTPRCGARAAAWLRQAVGQLGPAELSDLARGASQQCPSSTWLLMHDGINGTRSRKVFVTVSELGVLCYSESMANPETVHCLPLIGAEIGPTQSPNGFEITCLPKPGCANKMSFRFQAPDLQASFLWQNALQAASMRAGAGWLEVCSAFTWKCRWVVILTIPSTTSRGASRMSDGSRCSASLRAGSRWLLWFRSPEEMLLGDICGSVELGSTEVFNRNPRAHSFRVGYIQHRSGGEALSNLSLRARDEAEMDRWVEFIRSPQPSQPPQPLQPAPVMDTGRCSQESISHRSSECSISSPGSGGSRVFVPRLNLGACSRLESARSSQSKDSRASLTTASTTHSSPSPQKDLRRAKKKDRDRDTLWTEIHRDIITPRPGLATAPRIVERERQTCDSSSEDSDSDSESTQTISEPEAAVPSPGPGLATCAGSSTGLLTARLRHLNADVSSVSTYARMTALADEAESTVERLTSSLNETLEEGKRLLLFLGQKPPQNSNPETSQVELGVSVRSVFDTVNKFMHLLKGAVGDVERFQSRSTGRGSPAKSAPSSNYGFYRRRRSSACCARVTETDQCNQMARDCVLRAICRACKVDVPVAAATRVPKRAKAGQRLPAPPTEVVPVACAFDELD